MTFDLTTQNVLRELQSIERSGLAGKQFIVHQRSNVSVLFSDIVSFTTLASRLKTEDVVAILNVIFSAFDQLTTVHNVYKVETIGDAYMACTGVVIQKEHHQRDLVRCALALQEATSTFYTTVSADVHCLRSEQLADGLAVCGVFRSLHRTSSAS